MPTTPSGWSDVHRVRLVHAFTLLAAGFLAGHCAAGALEPKRCTLPTHSAES